MSSYSAFRMLPFHLPEDSVLLDSLLATLLQSTDQQIDSSPSDIDFTFTDGELEELLIALPHLRLPSSLPSSLPPQFTPSLYPDAPSGSSYPIVASYQPASSASTSFPALYYAFTSASSPVGFTHASHHTSQPIVPAVLSSISQNKATSSRSYGALQEDPIARPSSQRRATERTATPRKVQDENVAPKRTRSGRSTKATVTSVPPASTPRKHWCVVCEMSMNGDKKTVNRHEKSGGHLTNAGEYLPRLVCPNKCAKTFRRGDALTRHLNDGACPNRGKSG